MPYLSSFNYLQPILAQRPIWRDVPVERLPALARRTFAAVILKVAPPLRPRARADDPD